MAKNPIPRPNRRDVVPPSPNPLAGQQQLTRQQQSLPQLQSGSRPPSPGRVLQPQGQQFQFPPAEYYVRAESPRLQQYGYGQQTQIIGANSPVRQHVVYVQPQGSRANSPAYQQVVYGPQGTLVANSPARVPSPQPYQPYNVRANSPTTQQQYAPARYQGAPQQVPYRANNIQESVVIYASPIYNKPQQIEQEQVQDLPRPPTLTRQNSNQFRPAANVVQRTDVIVQNNNGQQIQVQERVVIEQQQNVPNNPVPAGRQRRRIFDEAPQNVRPQRFLGQQKAPNGGPQQVPPQLPLQNNQFNQQPAPVPVEQHINLQQYVVGINDVQIHHSSINISANYPIGSTANTNMPF
ncbi:MAG: hypothetical protein KF874_13305 [Rhizobiaceae bacterium]|nr:hypothetical protein [Rhizobiaceae bacterium]